MSDINNFNISLITFTATNARRISNFPDSPDELWMADLKVCHQDIQHEIFENILFVESGGMAFIYGIEFEDGYPKDLEADFALKQQSFIQFLRDETRRKNDALGFLRLVFTEHEYSTERKATAAYIAARGTSLMMGIGYRNNNGQYELIKFDPKENC
ncbi:hypothetical protein [Methylobacillus sp.]|uniref:hypothetical protein n=1 Tax=Methylobacillus sp. TaxID=56818 RepID=UPI002FE313B2